MSVAKAVRAARHYQKPNAAVRLLAIAKRPAVKRETKQALKHLGTMVPVEKVAGLIRKGEFDQIDKAIQWSHFREILKAPFARLVGLRNDAAALGVRKINGAFAQRRQQVSFRKSADGYLTAKGEAHAVTWYGVVLPFSKAVGGRFNFDAADQATQERIRAAQDELIQQLEDGARDSIESIVMNGVRDGLGPEDIAMDIRDLIGLTDTQATAVLNYQSMLYNLDPTALERQLRNGQYDELLQSAIDNGQDLSDTMIAKMVDDYTDNYLDYRAAAIAQTETVRAANEGLHDSYLQAIERGALPSEAIKRYWQLGDRPCPVCESIPDNNPDGVAVEEDFDSDDGPVTNPPIHTNCLPGHALVATRSISAASKRWFDGNLIVIRTASGNDLSCTPNHPILGPDGWRAANRVDIGQYVLSGRVSKWESFCQLDGNNRPTSIEKITEAFGRRSSVTAVPVPVSPPDFHGDGECSDVAIIWTDRLLSDAFYSECRQHNGEGSLIRCAGDADLLRVGNLNAMTGGLLSSSDRSMSSNCIGSSLLAGETRVSSELSVRTTSRFDVALQKASTNHRPADAKFLCQSLFGDTAEIFADEVIDVQVIDFHGYVFNLDTEDGLYIANGVVSHNCMCSVEYVTDLTQVPDE